MKKLIVTGLEIKNVFGNIGMITKVMTLSTGYVEVTFNGVTSKVMLKTKNYTTLNGTPLFAGKKETNEQIAARQQVKLSAKLAVTNGSPASWINADGTKNWDKYNDFLDEREAAARGSISM